MMRRWMVLMALVAAVGCAGRFMLGNKSLRLRAGMSRQQTRAAVGAPQDIIVRQQQGVMIETWQYLDGALVFHQDTLSSWIVEPSDQPSP